MEQKITDSSMQMKVMNSPLTQTLTIHSLVSKQLITKFPELEIPLANILKCTDIKTQKQALKTLMTYLDKISADQTSLNALAKLIIACYIDLAFSLTRSMLLNIINTLLDACTTFLKSSEERASLILNPDTPSNYIEYLFSKYMEIMNNCEVDIDRDELSRILTFVVERIEALRIQSLNENNYSLMTTLTSCLSFSSSLLKLIREPLECDIKVLRVLADGILELSKREFIDRDLLNLAGISYWQATSLLIKSIQIEHLNTVITEGNVNSESQLVKQVKNIPKKVNVLCIIKGFIKIVENVNDLYKKCVMDSSYFEFILQCCETDQLNTRIYALFTLNSLLERENSESPRGESWAKQILEVIIKSLDSAHKGTAKSAEDCLKSLLQAITRHSLQVIDVIIPLVDAISDSLRKRKLSAVTPMIEYLIPNDLKSVKRYIKYALESVLEDPSVTRLATLSINTILTKLRKLFTKTEDWLVYWCNDFIDTLTSSGDKIMNHLNSLVNIILDIDHEALPLLISQVLEMLSKQFKTEVLIVLLVLLIEARRLKKLKYKDNTLIVANKVEVEITEDLLTVLFNMSSGYVSLLILNLCTSNPKIAFLPESLDRLIFIKAISVPGVNTYDDYREKFTKLCKKYLTDLRLRYNHTSTKKEPTNSIELENDLTKIVSVIGNKLRIDSGYDMIYQPLSILKAIWESLGETAEKCNLHSRSLALFAVHRLFSTWELERSSSYCLLEKFPVTVLSMEEWKQFSKYALHQLCSPRSTEAEGAALYLKLIYKKLLNLKDFELEWDSKSKEYAESLTEEDKQLKWLKIILNRVNTKSKTLNETLFKKASCEDLFHGELRLLNLILQSTKLEQSEAAKEWKQIVDTLLTVLQEVSDHCENLLSFTGTADDETGNIAIDCRGRLSQKSEEVKVEIANASKTVLKDYYYADDYENLLSTGTWLLAKESGNLHKTLVEWLVFPGYGKLSWLNAEEIKKIALDLLEKILSYKHRGAFLKSVEVLQTILSKCFRSNLKELQAIPELILDKVYKYIEESTLESNQTLRRSAGIPHSILAVLRSEIKPVLLIKTLNWLLEMGTPLKATEIRVHSLNILRFILEDSDIHQDIISFVYKVLILATEGFSDPQWKIRNCSLMLFTSATKNIFGSSSTIESQLNKQGKSIYEFFGYSESLCKFMLETLKDNGLKNDPNSKFTVFPILLLFSRLAPSPFAKTKMYVAKYVPLFKQEIMKLLGHPDIGIRKIAAKGLLPLIGSYIKEAVSCITAIKVAGNSKFKLNLVHGLLELVYQLVKLSSKNDSNDSLVKALDSISFIMQWDQTLVQATLYKILNKLVKKEVDKSVFEKYQKLALKVCMTNDLIDTNQGFANSIRQQLTFITRFDSIHNSSFNSSLEVMEKSIKAKEWSNVAWIYKELNKVNASNIPCIEHIKILSKENKDATKQCLKFIIQQVEHIKEIETLNQYWDIVKLIKDSNKLEKELLILKCRLTKISLYYETKQWFNESTKTLMKEMLNTIYEAQYNESKHSMKLITAIEFTNVIPLLLPTFVKKGEFVELHTMAVRIVVLLLNSENAEIRRHVACEISEHLQISMKIKGKTLEDKEMSIEMANVCFNEEYVLNLLFDCIEKKMDDKEWIKQHINILWELITNKYFLENFKKNEGKNLVFAYEQTNDYLNNIKLKLFALKRLRTIPNAKTYLEIGEEYKKDMIPDEAVKELYKIKHQPTMSSKQDYIHFIESLIILHIREHILQEQTNASAIIAALKDSEFLNFI